MEREIDIIKDIFIFTEHAQEICESSEMVQMFKCFIVVGLVATRAPSKSSGGLPRR